MFHRLGSDELYFSGRTMVIHSPMGELPQAGRRATVAIALRSFFRQGTEIRQRNTGESVAVALLIEVYNLACLLRGERRAGECAYHESLAGEGHGVAGDDAMVFQAVDLLGLAGHFLVGAQGLFK